MCAEHTKPVKPPKPPEKEKKKGRHDDDLVEEAGGTPRPRGRAPSNDQQVALTWSYVRAKWVDCSGGLLKGRVADPKEVAEVQAENAQLEAQVEALAKEREAEEERERRRLEDEYKEEQHEFNEEQAKEQAAQLALGKTLASLQTKLAAKASGSPSVAHTPSRLLAHRPHRATCPLGAPRR